MVYSQARVAAISIPEIIPECVYFFIRIECPYCIGPALCYQLFEGGPHFGSEQSIVNPSLWFVNVEISWHNVIIACKNCRHILRQKLFSMSMQSLKPGKFVVEFRAR